MVDSYWRKIDDNLNNLENSIQIAGILLKLKEHETKIKDISKIDTNETNITSNLKKIDTNIKDISSNKTKIDNYTEHITKSNKNFSEKYDIEKQIFRFNRNKHFYTIFEKEIEYNFKINDLLFVTNNIFYKYDNISNDFHRLQHEYNIYDGDNLIHKYLFNKDTYYNENSDILHTNEDFCICFKQNYSKIKINLLLHRHNRHGIGNISCEIDDNDNYLKIDYFARDNENSIQENTKNIKQNESKLKK